LASSYRVTLARRVINRLVRGLMSLGTAGKTDYLLTVTGRKTGTSHAVTRPFFDAQPDSPLEAFMAEAPRLPVFSIRPTTETARV
jgi:hypothetical protein